MQGWKTLKKKLAAEGLLDKFFLESLDRKIGSAGRDGRFTLPEGAYFPLLIETHLRDVSSHLDRILSYRREMRELEILAVRGACDYALQREQAKAERDLAIVRLRSAQNAGERTAQTQAAAAFGDGDAGAGLKKIASGMAARLALDLSDAQTEARLITEMYERNRLYQDLYWQRQNEAGNAHNYRERADILLGLIAQDKFFAEQKCRALNLGFTAIYGRAPQTALKLSASIDELVMWVRDLFEEIGLEDQLESEFDLVLPMVQSQGGPGLISADTWRTALRNGVSSGTLDLSFEIKESHLLGRKRPRIRRIALSYGTEMGILPTGVDKSAVYESYCRYRGELVPPPQAVSGGPYQRPPVTLGAIAVYGAQVDWSDGAEVVNLNPIGSWRAKIKSRPATKDTNAFSFMDGADGATPWTDLKLHLRLRAKGQAGRRPRGKS